MKLNYFIPKPETLEELKALYRKLAMINHPDRGGNDESMKDVNNEYDFLFPKLKNIHMNKDGVKYEKDTFESVEFFKDLIAGLMKMDDIVVEVIGSFVWVSGDTLPYKNHLKDLKFLWHRDKSAWYLKPDNYKRYHSRNYSFNEIRDMYGSSGEFKSHGSIKLDDAESA